METVQDVPAVVAHPLQLLKLAAPALAGAESVTEVPEANPERV
jgi:hypothetical protein